MRHSISLVSCFLLLAAGESVFGGPITPGGVGVIGTQTGATGRYVRVAINRPTGVVGAEPRLHIGEIEAFLAGTPPANALPTFSPVQNVALGATFQSSTNAGITGGHSAGGATNAGRLTDGAEQSGGAVWSSEAVGGTMADVVIDLGTTRELGIVRVHQRNDSCCQGRLSDITVSVLSVTGADTPNTVANSAVFAAEAPTNSAAQVNLAGSLTIGSGDTLSMELLGGTSDQLTLTNLTLQAGSVLDIIDLGANSGTYQLFTITNPISGTFGTINLPDSSITGRLYNTSNLYTTGQLIITNTPEPATIFGFGAMGLAAACWAIQRRRRMSNAAGAKGRK